MKIEYEVVFTAINKEETIKKIIELGGICKKENTLMKRVVFKNPLNLDNSYLRIRDEGNKITCTYKEIREGNLDITSVKELETEIKDFDIMMNIFKNLGIEKKAFQESYREVWEIDNDIEIMLDEWPGIKPFIEIEGKDEKTVKKYSKMLGFDYNAGLFGAVDQIYLKELGIDVNIINNMKNITFDNPPKRKG